MKETKAKGLDVPSFYCCYFWDNHRLYQKHPIIFKNGFQL